MASNPKAAPVGLAATLLPAMPATGWRIPVWLLAIALGAPLFLLVWWSWERWNSAHRKRVSLLYRTGEDLMAAMSAPDIAGKLNAALPRYSGGWRGVIYLYNRDARWLELVTSSLNPVTVAIRPDVSYSGPGAGVALCFRNREPVLEPDASRGSLFHDGERNNPARSVLFLPMLAQGDILGVMEIQSVRKPYSMREKEQALFQHLANQAAAAVRLLEQKATRERMFRTERLSAAGQLIAGIAGELRSPLGSIIELTGTLKGRKSGMAGGEVELIEGEALRASEIVSRLASFGQPQQADVRPVDIHALLARLLRTRGNQRMGVEITSELTVQRILVLAAPTQMEQVFSDLLRFAERIASAAANPSIAVSSSLLASRLVIEIDYRTPAGNGRREDPFENGGAEASGMALCRSIIQSHGGDVRFARVAPAECRFEVELPVIEAQSAGAVNPLGVRSERRQLTVLLVEPEVKAQRHIRDVLGARGDRVVPVSNTEEAADVAQRLRFDLTVCSARLPGSNWVEFYERVRPQGGAFILLTQGHDPELARSFHDGEAFVLSKPVDEVILNRICDTVAERVRKEMR